MAGAGTKLSTLAQCRAAWGGQCTTNESRSLPCPGVAPLLAETAAADAAGGGL